MKATSIHTQRIALMSSSYGTNKHFIQCARQIMWVTLRPVTVAEQSEACTVFALSEAEIVGPNPTQGMDVWCVYVFILCLCCPMFR
jgi:hypothetical protein